VSVQSSVLIENVTTYNGAYNMIVSVQSRVFEEDEFTTFGVASITTPLTIESDCCESCR